MEIIIYSKFTHIHYEKYAYEIVIQSFINFILRMNIAIFAPLLKRIVVCCHYRRGGLLKFADGLG